MSRVSGVLAAVLAGAWVAALETGLVEGAAGASLPTAVHVARFFLWSLGCNVVGAAVVSAFFAALPERVRGVRWTRRTGVRVLFAIATAVIVVVDMRAFPHLYRAAHLALDVGAWACALLACSIGGASRRVVGAAAAAVVVSVCAAWGAFYLDANLRWVASDYAPISGDFAKVLTLRTAPPIAAPQTVSAPRADVQIAAETCTATGADVIMVTVDALRADRAFGERGARLMPELTRAAEDAVTFSNAYTTTPNTSYAMASLFTGTNARPLMEMGDAPSLGLPTLFEVLSARGFATAAFYPPGVFSVDRAKFAAWEASSFGAADSFVNYDDAERRTDAALAWLRARPDASRVAMWIHLFDPHEPYAPPAELASGDSPVGRYEGEVRFVDRAFGRLFREVRALRPNSVVVFAADHGEAFGEHGGAFHGTSLYDEQTRIPLVIWVPGCTPRVVGEPVSLASVAPAILRALAFPAPPSMRLPSPLVETPPVVASLENLWLARRGSKKAICSRALECRVYDLAADADERFDVAERDAASYADLARVVRDHIRTLADIANGDEASDAMAILSRARLGDASMRERVVSLVGDRDPVMRAAAVGTLADMDARLEVAMLARVAAEDADAVVRAEAMLALVRLGDDTHSVALEALATNDESAFSDAWKDRVALVLAARGGRAFAARWARIAADESKTYEEREAALAAIGRTRPQGARQTLEPYLAHVRLRVEAARALGVLGDRRALPALKRARAEETYPLAMAAEDQAIAALSRRATRPSR